MIRYEGLTTSANSTAWEVLRVSDVTITLTGTQGGSTVTLQQYLDGAWSSFLTPDSTGTVGAVTMTEVQTKLLSSLPTGRYRLACTGGTSVDLDVFVKGRYVAPIA